MINLINRIRRPRDYFIKTNLLENRYVTDGCIWTVDETIFNDNTKVFLIVSLKTRAILGMIQSENRVNEDLIIELYKKILKEYHFQHTPCFIHSDMEETYHSAKVQLFLEEHKIFVSVTEGKKNQNQLSESINNRIKYLVTQLLIDDPNAKGYRQFYATLPDNLKLIQKTVTKCQDKQFRDFLFKSNFFKSNRQTIISDAILKYNKTPYIKGISRQEAEYYDSLIEHPNIENTNLVKSDHNIANQIKNENVISIQQVKLKVSEVLQTSIGSEEKINKLIALVFEKQANTDNILQQGFIGIASQNIELKEQLDKQFRETQLISKQLEEVLNQQLLVDQKRAKRKNRKRLPRRDALTEDIYNHLIDEANKSYNETYLGARLRLALAILCVTGVRISELLPLKMSQIENLFAKSWIGIDRIKRGPVNHKAFLTPKGKQIIKQRARDFEIITFQKNSNSYIFTPQNTDKPLCRQAFNRIVNSFIKESTENYKNQPNLKSYSFRIGFITDLWKDSGDIEFVRQSIGHARVDTTSNYIQNLTEDERQMRMTNIKNTDDLFYEN